MDWRFLAEALSTQLAAPLVDIDAGSPVTIS